MTVNFYFTKFYKLFYFLSVSYLNTWCIRLYILADFYAYYDTPKLFFLNKIFYITEVKISNIFFYYYIARLMNFLLI
jgi:hypothetical protein